MVAFIGCSDELVSTSADTGEIVSAGKNGPPAQSGPKVFRFEAATAFIVDDPTNGNQAWLGQDVFALCAGQPSLDLMAHQDVIVEAAADEEDADRIVRQIKGDDIAASVWNPAPATCGDVLSGTGLVGAGTADLTYADNDYFTFLTDDNNNNNAFGLNAHGNLEGPEGESVRMNAHTRCVWDGIDLETLKCNDKVGAQ